MIFDLQKASMWKRMGAALLDLILILILFTGFSWTLSQTLGYDGYNTRLNQAYDQYEKAHGITFQITEAEYAAMTEAERAVYDRAYQDLIRDEEAMYAYNMVMNLTLAITTFAILLAILAVEFAVPLVFKNGQTLGKKVFGLGLMRVDGVRLTTLQLFVRTLLGKFTLETMIPVYIVIMIFFNSLGVTGTLILAAIGVLQLCILGFTKNNSLLHDLLAATVCIDLGSQMIFDTPEDLLEFKKQVHADMAARADY